MLSSRSLGWCFALLLPALPAGASADSPRQQAWLASLQSAEVEHAQSLARRGDSQSLLQALLISQGQAAGIHPGLAAQRADWQARLAALPQTPASAWYLWQQCVMPTSSCALEPALDRLAAADPGNGWVALLRAQHAGRDGDAERALAELRQAAELGLQPEFFRFAQSIATAMSGVTLPALDDALAREFSANWLESSERAADPSDLQWTGAMARLAGQAQAEFGALRDLCRPGQAHVSESEWTAACVQLSRSMAMNADNLLERSIGLAYAGRLAEGNAAIELAELQRETDWLLEIGVNTAQLGLSEPGATTAYVRSLFEHGELAALRAAMLEHGHALQPEPEWMPSDASKRDRIEALRQGRAAP